jgi:hypothetical protein
MAKADSSEMRDVLRFSSMGFEVMAGDGAGTRGPAAMLAGAGARRMVFISRAGAAAVAGGVASSKGMRDVSLLDAGFFSATGAAGADAMTRGFTPGPGAAEGAITGFLTSIVGTG